MLKDIAHGNGTWWEIDGSKFSGTFYEGRPQGGGSAIEADGSSFTGVFKDGIKDGYGIYTNKYG